MSRSRTPHHWRITTSHKLLLLLILAIWLTGRANAQPIRYDQVSSTTNSACAPGAICPVMAIPGSTVNFCTPNGFGVVSTANTVVTWVSGPTFAGASGSIQIAGSAYQIQTVVSSTILVLTASAGTQTSVQYSTLAACLANPLTTYTSVTGGTTCPLTAQLTPATGGACVSTSDNQGNFGIWYSPQTAYYYLSTPATAGGKVAGPFPFSFGVSGQAAGVTYSYPASGVTRTVGAKLQEIPSILDFGAKCANNIANDDGVPTQAAITAIPSSSTLTVPGVGCYIKTGVTISKPMTLSAGAAGSPTPQFIAGTNSESMFTVSATGSVKFAGIGFSTGSATGVTGVSLAGTSGSPLSKITFTDDQFSGTPGDNSTGIACTYSFFNNITNTGFHGVNAPVSFTEQCNSTTVLNSNFYPAESGSVSAILAHNMQGLTVLGSTLECGSQITTYNDFGIEIAGNYFEDAGGVGCPSMVSNQYIGIGASFAGSPDYGVDISGNLFNGSATWGISIGYGRGVHIHGNTFQNCIQTVPGTCDAGTLAVNVITSASATSTYALNNDIDVGPNDYGLMTEAEYIGFTGSGNNNTTASNVSANFVNPMRFSWAQLPPQQAHVPVGDGILYWETTDGTSATGGALHGLWNNNSSFQATVPLYDAEFFTSGISDVTKFHGSATLTSNNGTTNGVCMIPQNNHISYFCVDDSAGDVTGTPYGTYVKSNDAIPVFLCEGTQGCMSWTSLGIQSAPVAMTTSPTVTFGTCNSAKAGFSAPVSNSSTNTPGAVITGTGAYGGYAHCTNNNGSYAWQFSF